MARPTYGPDMKNRAKRLLAALLDYANNDLEGYDQTKLDALRPQIQIQNETEYRLVVKTKARFLSTLTGLQPSQTPMTIEQIKEALKRFADFLEILEDNRRTTGSSEVCHFTLKLWHKRQDTEANLQQFEVEWENRRLKKSKALAKRKEREKICPAHCTPLHPYTSTPLYLLKYWQEICYNLIKAQSQMRLTTNPLINTDGTTHDLDEIYIPVGLVEKKHQDKRSEYISPPPSSRFNELEEIEVTQRFSHNEFLEQLLRFPQSKIAIVGEAGSGKTTLLRKIAFWVLKNTQDFPIWVSLADLQGKTLEQYLIQDWLHAATGKQQISSELQTAFCTHFHQGRVWLLLDAVDEMEMDSCHALSKIAGFLNGWVANARIILTCRLNVWDAGQNVLDNFDIYRHLNFSYGDSHTPDLVGQFIHRWFQHHPPLGQSLRAELEQPGKQHIKDTVTNPLHLALLCRVWEFKQGKLPNTKSLLYQQFVETIYECKQDFLPTKFSQKQQLHQALSTLALQAIFSNQSKSRLTPSLVSQVLGVPDEGLFQLALELGWLNQVGISQTQGEKLYAFYHPSFQEYFAALAINDWHFFLNVTTTENSPHTSCRIFEPQWWEIILLWLGRNDIPPAHKEEFIHALTQFEDNVGGFYSYQAYFLAAVAISEFPDCSLSHQIVTQLIKWCFGYFHPIYQKWCRFPSPIVEGARYALLKTDRQYAIAALEEFIQSSHNQFDTWNAAYSLATVFAPGNQVAITALEKIVTSLRHESLRAQAADCLGKVDPGNQLAIIALTSIIESTHNESLYRKAAYSLGKIDPGNPIAISILETMIISATNDSLRRQAAVSLIQISPQNPIALFVLAPTKGYVNKPLKTKSIQDADSSAREIATLVKGINSTKNKDTKRKKACQLAKTDPGNPIAFRTLLNLVKSGKNEKIRKATVEDIKKVVLTEQMPELIISLRECFSDKVSDIEIEKSPHSYKLLWYCAQKMSYHDFYQAWHFTTDSIFPDKSI
jgi:predicted NACHT family NTPase